MDFLISKPGGVSLFESIYAGVPYIAMYPSFEHEIENANFIERNNIGIVIRQGMNVYDAINNLIADEGLYKSFQSNILKIRNNIENAKNKVGRNI